jgi:DNA repair photolyase
MSNTDDVVDMVNELGAATVDAIAPLLPHLTKDQIRHAMKNARVAGRIKVGQRGKRAGQRKGSLPSTWVPCARKPHIEQSTAPRGEYASIGRVNSVWALGA